MAEKPSSSKNAFQDSSRVMSPEQFDCIVKAIVEGKYSWACVLILRFAGYNPAHYIPYRTYKRLIRENRQRQTAEQAAQKTTSGRNALLGQHTVSLK
ncbi:MAG: hypothetical protein Kow00121_01230 [Elainellaceae cyanobacterium]